jgi:hypothetical protein
MNHTNHTRNTNEEQPQQALNNAARAESNDGKTTKGNAGVMTNKPPKQTQSNPCSNPDGPGTRHH